MTATVYDQRPCELGEGPLWHPLREDLFWFDIENHRMLAKDQMWQFQEPVSAAGWISRDELLIASASQLFRFDLRDGQQRKVVDLETDNPVTRSNDGRADSQGGFWIGTMGRNAEPGAGAIYRYFKGELRKLVTDVTISNAICFAPDGRTAYYCDTPSKKILRTALDADGWPSGEPSVAIDLNSTGEAPDGAVVDADGNIWNAQWGAARVACYAPDGTFLRAVDLPAPHVTCPAFAGASGRMFATSAMQGIDAAGRLSDPAHGQTFEVTVDAIGQSEHCVTL